MKILAIDTSTLTGSVALMKDGDVVGEMTLSVSAKHSERLLPAVDRLLSDAGESLEAIDLFATSVGPGSFTGLRIAIATVQAFCLAHQRPFFGISTLQALACNGGLFSGLVIPLLDARRGEVYAGIYRVNGTRPPQIIGEELALTPEQLVETLQEPNLARSNILLVGEGSRVYREKLNQGLKGRALFAPPAMNYPRAAHVGSLAYFQVQRGGVPDKHLLPRYVRPAEVSYPITSFY